MPINIQQSIFLLHSKPRVLILGRLHSLKTSSAVIGCVWLKFIVKGFAPLLGLFSKLFKKNLHYEFVISKTEWVLVNSDWLKENIRVRSMSLIC